MKIKSKKLKSEGKTALEFLKQNNQQVDIIERFWEPLILATTNAPSAVVSEDLLLAVLERAFFNGKKASRLLLPTVGLSSLFEPFQEWFEAKGGRLLLKTRPKELLFKNNRIVGVRLEDKVKIFCDAVISAVPPKSLLKMLPEELSIGEYFKSIADYQYSTIISIYIWLDREILQEDFAALLGTNVQWIFNKRKIIQTKPINKDYPYFYALTISAADELAKLPAEELIEICISEMKEALPPAREAKLLHYRVIKSRQATILATPEINKIRLGNKTPVENFFIAGDWTNTGLPATIESAALSGELAAGMATELDT